MATNWVDVQDNYMVNENAINWNGALVYALALFLPAGEWPPLPPDPDPPVDGGADAGDADGGADAADASGPRTRMGGGCGCAFSPRAADTPLPLLGLLAALVRRRNRARSQARVASRSDR